MRKHIFWIVVLFMGSMLFISPVQAEDYYRFERNLTYDIYFNSAEEHVSVINDVEIKGFEEIAGRTFLVIRAKGFKLSEEEGYILFDSVTAILPERNFRVNKAVKYKYR